VISLKERGFAIVGKKAASRATPEKHIGFHHSSFPAQIFARDRR
jgi:hypothetical protein